MQTKIPKLIIVAILIACGAAAQNAGYSAPWDVTKLMAALTDEAKRLQPIVAQADPQRWKNAASGRSYEAQWKSALDSVRGNYRRACTRENGRSRPVHQDAG